MPKYRIVEYKDGFGMSTYYGQKYLGLGMWKSAKRHGNKVKESRYSNALKEINILLQIPKTKQRRFKIFTRMVSEETPDHIPFQQKEEYLKTCGEGKKYETEKEEEEN